MRAGSPATPFASTAAPSSEAASVQEIDAMNPASSRRRDQYGTSADETLLDQYLRLRQHTQALVARLNHEDMAVQTLPDPSPGKRHLAHTTWLFETFLLSTSLPGHRQVDPMFCYLFKSYL